MSWCGGHLVTMKSEKLVVLPEYVIVNKDRYLKLLADHLQDYFTECHSKSYRQYGAPVHSAKLVHDWLAWVGVNYIRDWQVTALVLTP